MAEIADKRYYVLRAVSGKEYEVCKNVESEIRNTDLGRYVFNVFVPTEKVVIQRKDGKRLFKERPMLPGYVLVEAVLVGDVTHRLRSMQNVIGFLGANKGGEPEPMHSSEVERLMRMMDEVAESDGTVDLSINIGDTIRVTDGAFAGSVATVESVIYDKRKLNVIVKMFGRTVPLELTFSQVSKE